MAAAAAPPGPLLLWQLAHGEHTGQLLAQVAAVRAAPVQLALVRGWVHAIDWFPLQRSLGRAPPSGEARLRALLLRSDVTWGLGEGVARPGPVRPFHPAALLRELFTPAEGEQPQWAADLFVRVVSPPHRSALALDERALVAGLTRPRRLGDLFAHAHLPRRRLRELLSFLFSMGALALSEAVATAELPLAAAYALLELSEDASATEVKRAYRRLARALHPDLHVGASDDERRELTGRFVALHAAYRRLLVG